MTTLKDMPGIQKELRDKIVMSTQAAVSAADGVAAAGANPTKAEFDAVVTLANANKAAINALLTKLKNAGLMES